MVEGMKEIVQLMEEWQLNVGDLRERMYRAPTPRERERPYLLKHYWNDQFLERREGGLCTDDAGRRLNSSSFLFS